MKQEIGGYLELEVFHGKEYYPDLVKVNLGRTALCWLLESRKIETLYLPFFLCDSVIDICLRQGIHVNFYSLNEDLTPALSPDLSLHPREYLYLVNYYGQLTDEKILYYKKYYKKNIDWSSVDKITNKDIEIAKKKVNLLSQKFTRDEIETLYKNLSEDPMKAFDYYLEQIKNKEK